VTVLEAHPPVFFCRGLNYPPPPPPNFAKELGGGGFIAEIALPDPQHRTTSLHFKLHPSTPYPPCLEPLNAAPRKTFADANLSVRRRKTSAGSTDIQQSTKATEKAKVVRTKATATVMATATAAATRTGTEMGTTTAAATATRATARVTRSTTRATTRAMATSMTANRATTVAEMTANGDEDSRQVHTTIN
jgi:hypothetical protein